MASVQPTSANFGFLVAHDPLLDHLGALAERYFAADPSTCLVKLRQFGEVLAQRTAARAGLYTSTDENQAELLSRLRDSAVLTRDVADLFHGLRKAGNAATHDLKGDHREALFQLRMAWKLGVWFHRTFKAGNFAPSPFVPPPDPAAENAAIAAELARLREELAKHQTAADAARAQATVAAEARLTAEQRAAKEAEERAIWEALAAEAAGEQSRLAQELQKLQASATVAPTEQLEAIVLKSTIASDTLDLSEADTRQMIDAQLRLAGWEVDSLAQTYASGARPQKGRNLAIAEWPTKSGPADYVLFVGLDPVGIVEAKRKNKDVSASLEQAKRYSRGYTLTPDQRPSGEGPWGEYVIPFLFATNGRPYLQQLATRSGIWFLDARRAQNISRPLEGWYTPDGLVALLKQDIDRAEARLAVEPTEYLHLRDYQLAAIRAVEAAIKDGQRSCLVAMATGTGKTRTCIGLTYRLLSTRRFRRVLFLVDRSALGEQTANAYKDARLENRQTFAEIFGIKELADIKPDPETRLQIATIQGMVKRILFPSNPDEIPPVDQYDCIVVDECHRGYLLDRELSDTEFEFRNEADFISKYRRVLDHFDAVKIGLTATPALHTTQIFGRPVYQYSYREAVIDGTLIDHEPPTQIVTRLASDGIHWKAGEQMFVYQPHGQKLDTVTLDDDVDIEIDSFNKRVETRNFNRVVCAELAKHIDPTLEGKTLVFCATDSHADMVVQLLKEAFAERYDGVEDNAVVKITGASDKPNELIRRFKNENNPSVVVTVDLLTTGIDVPKICNIVFLRRVRSRILYEQMLGRATRQCEEIGKEVFRVFDAVDLYGALEPVSTMTPVVTNPKISFAELVEALAVAKTDDVAQAILDQIIVKLDRKRHRLSKGTLGEHFDHTAGMSPAALLAKLRSETPKDASAWFAAHPSLVEVLDYTSGEGGRVIVSPHDDQVLHVTHGYSGGVRPQDYLESFAGYLQANLNTLPALLVVTQRPRELTRQQLKELRLALDTAGYTEVALQTAWRDTTNQDIAASIIGFIRQAALGDALVPYGERVDRALKKTLASQPFTEPQRKWLERIGMQLREETIVDRAALDSGPFKTQGGYSRINKIFDGKLDAVLGDLHEALWQAA